MKLFFVVVVAICFANQSIAEDSTAIFEKRRKDLKGIDFWCETARAPMASSLEGLNFSPGKSCTYGGPLDTKIVPRILEPPLLNPTLRLDVLRDFILRAGGSIENESASRLAFSFLGERFVANVISYKQLKDTYMRLGFYPSGWGQDFVSISANSPAGVRRFAEAAQSQAPMVFSWANPHYAEEAAIWPRLTGGPRAYLPVELVPRCQVAAKWNPAGRALLLVGDTHVSRDTQYFLNLIQNLPMAFVQLEISNDFESILKEFLEARTPAEENLRLDKIVARLPNEITEDFRNIFRTLKRRQIQIILMDYREPYLNFPFTNTAFHGSVIALRNKLWADRLPATWNGYGVIMAGIDHFAEVPGHDLQNFLVERFPGITLGLVNPYENCN